MKKTLLMAITVFITGMAQAQVTNGLVAKYSFNNGNANDEIGSNNGTVTGASLTADRFGNANKAYSFDGIDDHIDLGDVAPFRMGNNDFSISIWVNYSTNQQANIISKRSGAGTNYNMYTLSVTNDPQFGGTSPNIWAFLRSGNSNDRDILAGNLLGTWHHIVLVHKYATNTSVFVDGQFVGSDAATVSGLYDIVGHPLVLGYASESNSNFYKGSMDDIRVYNRAISSLEVAGLFNDPNPVVNLAAGLVAKYSFNAGNANDEIGSNNGTVTGASLTTDRFGNANKAYAFDGVNDKIDFGDAVAFRMGNNNFSISLWAQFSDAQFAPLLNKRNDNPSFDQYAVNVGQYGTPDKKLGFYYKPSPGGIGAVHRSFSGNTMDSSWHHVTVISIFGSASSLYIDGQFVGTDNATFTTQNFNITGASLTAGFTNALGTDYYYKGNLDDIRIYNRALSSLEADSLFKEANPVSVGVQEKKAIPAISIYPNPTRGNIALSNSCNISIVDITGKVVLTAQNTNSIDMATQPAGIYFITLTNARGELIQRSKLIKE